MAIDPDWIRLKWLPKPEWPGQYWYAKHGVWRLKVRRTLIGLTNPLENKFLGYVNQTCVCIEPTPMLARRQVEIHLMARL